MRLITILRALLPLLFSFLRDRRRCLVAGRPAARNAEFHRRRADRLVATLAALGPSFVKIGQLFAGRSDLLPEPYASALARLTDQVPPVPFPEVRGVIEAALDRPLEAVFGGFDQAAMAAGSLGLVYRARYRGRDVAVKVLRPGVEGLVRRDLAVAARLVGWIAAIWPNPHTRGAAAVLAEFGVRIWEEMDFGREADNLRTVRANFAANPQVRIPAVVAELSSRQVLVMEYLEGTRIDRLDPARRYGGLGAGQVVERLVELYLQMMLIDGWFHADPHPGNLLVAPDGALVLLDFGVLIPVPAERRRQLVDTVFAALRRDPDGVTAGFYALGIVEPGVARERIRELAAILVELGARRTTTQERIDLLTHEIMGALHEWPIRLPSDLVYYARTASLIEGIGIGYDPRFNPIQAAAPVLFRMRGRLVGSPALSGVMRELDLPTVIGYALGRATAFLSGAGGRLWRIVRAGAA